VRIRPDAAAHIVYCDFTLVGSDGQLLGLIENAEGVCSKALNRLTQLKDTHESRYVHERP
jgi:hypothetical protein